MEINPTPVLEDIHEELYVSLHKKALEIVLYRRAGGNYTESRNLAHDVTVDFIFNSESYNGNYFDPTRSIKPYFSSYVSKKLMGYFERETKRAYRYPSLTEKYLESVVASCDGGLGMIEFAMQTRGMSKYLEKKYFVTCREAVSLVAVFWATLECYSTFGGLRIGWLSEKLGCRKQIVRGCVAKMRRTLKAGGFCAA